MKKREKKSKTLERIAKGFANQRRLEMLEILDKEPELSVEKLSRKIKLNFRTTSDHIKKMVAGGLVMKRYFSNEVLHKLTDRGKVVVKFLKDIYG